jgi:MoxR-like ATPase
MVYTVTVALRRFDMNDIIRAVEEVKKVVRGKDEIIRSIMMTILSGGHILLEDVPGVGKTTLAVAFSRVLGLEYKRIQFTPDVMPSDVTGFSMYNKKTDTFDYVPGGAMCNILLADEINRTSPKTQSALLEVMEEGKVTVDGITREVPKPFVVIATQNPFGSSGTQRLPQSQLDRFRTRLSIGYPDKESEIMILKGRGMTAINDITPVFDRDRLVNIQSEVSGVFVSDELYSFITDIAIGTRESELFDMGISPRGSLAVLRLAKASAYMDDRDYVVPEDVLDVVKFGTAHRVEISERARAIHITEQEAIGEVIKHLDVPKG